MDLIKNLKWRYAVKKYSDESVSEDKIDQMIEAINLTASSCGIQPYRLYVITNPEIRQRLGEGCHGGMSPLIPPVCRVPPMFRRLPKLWLV